MVNQYFNLYFYSGACIINDPTYTEESYVLTGGSDGNKENFTITRQVVRYNLNGPIYEPYELPDLNFGRIERCIPICPGPTCPFI